MPVTFKLMAHDAVDPRVPVVRLIVPVPGTAVTVPPQVLLSPFGFWIDKPIGKVSVKVRPVNEIELGFTMANDTDTVSPWLIESIPKAFAKVGGAIFVNAKFAGANDPTVAVTVYDPGVLLALKMGAVATPIPSVITTQVIPLQGDPKLPLGPELGAWKVTFTFGTPTLPASRTVACNLVGKAVLIA